MTLRSWHPYAPDQAFGHQASQDEELVDQILARLDGSHRAVPRAGNKAPSHQERPVAWQPTARQLGWVAADLAEGPVTTASVLDEAPSARSRPL